MDKGIYQKCHNCGTMLRRTPSSIFPVIFCNRACSASWKAQRMAEINEELNPTRMILETRQKVRLSRLGKGEGKGYAKTFSKPTHRIVAEQMLGRPLNPGEVVHHEDENKRNNDPSNLRVFASQAEHARYHMNKKHQERKNGGN